ncbi:hypothetical protein AOX59_16955 [Lentibacillus amyloliquefaciens]|uniref:Uncharacterized protein n=2 Tax=Lentibacillus amyloliquefaciens TaxID=1472767 RepID=A0A0U4FQY3_9BACI|nr:hypothetical protein AOX59_16955 [Lentibacillus amyloliquefaciens]
MEKYRMGSTMNQSVVNGILQGYKNYIEERKAKKEEMHISTAYAWVKGNHIDDQTAEECKESGISFTKAKAGYTWGYLQFNIDNDKRMFIIKNAKYFDEDDFPHRKDVRGQKHKASDKETYLKRLSRINSNVDFPEEPTLFPEEKENKIMSIFGDETLKELEDPQARELEYKFNQFYIITYEIDESFAISNIRMLMPNPDNDKAYEVENLSKFIGTSTVTFDENDYEALAEDGFDVPDTPAATEYDIVLQEELFDDDKKGEEK